LENRYFSKNTKKNFSFSTTSFLEDNSVTDSQSKHNKFALLSKDSLTKSFVEAVNGINSGIHGNIDSVRPNQRKEQRVEKSQGFFLVPQIKAPKLPGLYPFLKFKTFKAPDSSA
jgi:hypothetical protein